MKEYFLETLHKPFKKVQDYNFLTRIQSDITALKLHAIKSRPFKNVKKLLENAYLFINILQSHKYEVFF